MLTYIIFSCTCMQCIDAFRDVNVVNLSGSTLRCVHGFLHQQITNRSIVTDLARISYKTLYTRRHVCLPGTLSELALSVNAGKLSIRQSEADSFILASSGRNRHYEFPNTSATPGVICVGRNENGGFGY